MNSFNCKVLNCFVIKTFVLKIIHFVCMSFHVFSIYMSGYLEVFDLYRYIGGRSISSSYKGHGVFCRKRFLKLRSEAGFSVPGFSIVKVLF